jgi:hypothetical protein
VPFISQAQWKYMWANHPDIARRWADMHPSAEHPKRGKGRLKFDQLPPKKEEAVAAGDVAPNVKTNLLNPRSRSFCARCQRPLKNKQMACPVCGKGVNTVAGQALVGQLYTALGISTEET